jgi:hypothetical protein
MSGRPLDAERPPLPLVPDLPHGAPKGEIDIPGYPNEGDLGGVISITLYR